MDFNSMENNQVQFPGYTPDGTIRKKGNKGRTIAIILAAVLLFTNLITAGFLAYNFYGTGAEEEEYNLFDDHGLIRVKSGELWGYVNSKGEYVISPRFDDAKDFYENMAIVSVGGKYGYIDTTGKYLINPQFDYAEYFPEDGLAVVKVDDKYGYIDKTGKYVISPRFDKGSYFWDGVATVKVDDKYGLIDRTGNYIVTPQFDDMGSNWAGRIPAKIGNLWGYINTKGENVIPYQFAKASTMYDDGVAIVVTTSKEYALIDKNGNILVSGLKAIDYEDDTFCIEEGCYEATYGDEFCYDHRYRCAYYGCTNEAYTGDYCTDHDYME